MGDVVRTRFGDGVVAGIRLGNRTKSYHVEVDGAVLTTSATDVTECYSPTVELSLQSASAQKDHGNSLSLMDDAIGAIRQYIKAKQTLNRAKRQRMNEQQRSKSARLTAKIFGNLCLCYKSRGEYKPAAESARQAIAADPTNTFGGRPKYLTRLGRCCYKLKEWEGVVAAFSDPSVPQTDEVQRKLTKSRRILRKQAKENRKKWKRIMKEGSKVFSQGRDETAEAAQGRDETAEADAGVVEECVDGTPVDDDTESVDAGTGVGVETKKKKDPTDTQEKDDDGGDGFWNMWGDTVMFVSGLATVALWAVLASRNR